jgi:histone-lysine N-methyltransferase SETD1
MSLPLAQPLLRDTSSSQSSSALNRNSLTISTNSACLNPSLGHENRVASTIQQDSSEGSDSSTPSSVFSRMSSFTGNGAPTLTPITNSESSPPDKPSSPTSNKRKFDQIHTNGSTTPSHQNAPPPQDSALTPTQTPPEIPREARPGPGQIKGHKLTFDPDTALNLDSSSRKKLRPKYNTFGDQVRAASSQVIFDDVKFRD